MKSQPLQALDSANAVRFARAQLKREIKEGRVKLSAVLRDGIPDYCGSMNVESLLKTPYRMPWALVARLLAEARLSPYQRAGQITDRQRLLLADRMEEWEAKRGEKLAAVA